MSVCVRRYHEVIDGHTELLHSRSTSPQTCCRLNSFLRPHRDFTCSYRGQIVLSWRSICPPCEICHPPLALSIRHYDEKKKTNKQQKQKGLCTGRWCSLCSTHHQLCLYYFVLLPALEKKLKSGHCFFLIPLGGNHLLHRRTVRGRPAD